jgi:hypothetical protein
VAGTTPDSANDRGLVLIDPDYQQPSEWKFTAGLTYTFPGGLRADLDYLHTEMRDSAYYVDLSQEVVGTTRAGAPIYDFTNGEDNLMLTNSSFSAASDIFSVLFTKYFASGLDVSLGSAYTDSQDISPMTSSVALSNFGNLALTDLNNPAPGTSNYEVPHRISLRASYGHDFFENLETRFTLYAFAQEGQPQSFGMSSSDLEGDGFFGRHLLYVPDGASDPNVVFAPGFPADEFFAFVAREELDPGFVPRNSKHARWSKRADLGVYQDLPTGLGEAKGRLFFKVYNVGNLLNDGWGKVHDAVFFTPVFVDSSVNSDGQYVFEDFSEAVVSDLLENRSLWEARVGIEIRF